MGDNTIVYGNNNPHVHKKYGNMVMVTVMMAVVMVVMMATTNLTSIPHVVHNFEVIVECVLKTRAINH